MTKDIVGKLTKFLIKPIAADDEAAVVYVLAEVRKLLERDDKDRRFEAVWMHCHWGLHVDLHSPGTVLEFLRFVDLWVTNTVHGLLPRGDWKFQQELILFRDFVYLDTFRRELGRFLKGYGIPTTLCDDDNWWNPFLAAYAGVIEDGSLNVRADVTNELGAVKSVTFCKGRSLGEGYHVNFVIKWSIELKDGRILDTEVDAEPGKRMSGHQLSLRHPAGYAPATTLIQS